MIYVPLKPNKTESKYESRVFKPGTKLFQRSNIADRLKAPVQIK